MYKYLNNKYDELSTKIKVEIVFLTMLIFYGINYLFFTYYLKDEVFSYSKVQVNDFNKKFDGSYLELFSKIELLATENKIFIKNLAKDKNFVVIDGYSKKEFILIFLKEIENINNFTKIDSMILNKKDDLGDYSFHLRLDLNRFYTKKLNILKKEIPNKKDSLVKESKHFKINAIILNYAFINDTWIKKNEKIDNYELIQIERDFVLLKKDEDTIKLELINE